MRARRDERGFSLVELLVAISIFSILSVSLYQVLFSQSTSSSTTRSVVRVSEEARAGLNRMVRDTREALTLVSASDTAYRVHVDFDGNGVQTFPDVNSSGDYEDLTFEYDAGSDSITLNDELLIDGVAPVTGQNIFSYSSNLLEYDANADGITTWQELDGSTIGNGNGRLDTPELSAISDVSFAVVITSGETDETFFARAQLRNRRFRS